jgi:hypothetical protein
MRVPTEILNHALNRCGSVQLAADYIGMNATKFRATLTRHLQSAGESAEHLQVRKCIEVINKYLDKPYQRVRERIANPRNPYGVAICHVDDRLVVRNPNKIEGTLVGVYDRDGSTDDMRDDLYWYVKNHMEAEQ